MTDEVFQAQVIAVGLAHWFYVIWVIAWMLVLAATTQLSRPIKAVVMVVDEF